MSTERVRDTAQKSPLGSGAKVWFQLFFGLACFFVIITTLGYFLRAPLEELGRAWVAETGLWGYGALVLFLDLFPLPVGYPLFLYLTLQGGEPVLPLLWITAVMSTLAGPIGYLCGAQLGIPRWLQRRVDDRWPTLFAQLKERGIIAAALITTLPFPFALASWPAGALQLPFRQFLLVSLIRVGKAVVYLMLILASLKITASA
ncbi:MAG: VTT domain-containing protein [Myxococcota bacterium]|nr:VTT domain-containing protein [Myxococcota bacterium]